MDRDNLLELPTGWVWAEIGYICEGIVPGRTKPKNFDGTIPWITLPDVKGLYISKSKSHLAVTREDAEEVGMRVMPKGTVLMSCVGQFGIICIAEDDLVPNQQFHGFLCLDKIFPEYIAYSLMTQVDQMKQLSSATTIAYINKTKCNSIQIPLAPLNEQRRIVAKIEALKARSQRVKEEVEAIPALLDQFRQSVLATAFRGDLTADWREKNPDVEPASVLLERIRAERRHRWEEAELEKMKVQGKTPKDDKWKAKYKEPKPVDINNLPELPDGWHWIAVEEFADVGTGATPLRNEQKYYECGTIPWVTSGALNEPFISTAKEYITALAIKETNAKIFPKYTLLVALYGEGKTRGKVSELVIEATTNQACAALILEGIAAKIRPTVKLFFQKNYSDLRRLASGGVQPNLNLSMIKATAVPLPPLEEQTEIIRAVARCMLIADAVEKQYLESIELINHLDQSILAKAFRGELVPQDPNDEPASILLERIRAEREKLDTKKKAKGKTEKKSHKAKPELAEPKQLSLPGFE
ncbi:restriction endonuclease subunit S [Microcoleus sp. B7-D4]